MAMDPNLRRSNTAIYDQKEKLVKPRPNYLHKQKHVIEFESSKSRALKKNLSSEDYFEFDIDQPFN